MSETLNLSALNGLISLRCIIDDSLYLLETKILSTAKRLSIFEFEHTVIVGETLDDFLFRIYQGAKQYEMDCTIYAQLASLVLTDKWPYDGGKFYLIMAGNQESQDKLLLAKISQMGYITVTSKKVTKYLQDLPTSAKGEWCIQIAGNKFLGLACSGPAIWSMEEWVSELRQSIKIYIGDRAIPVRMTDYHLLKDNCIKGILDCYFNLGKMDEWGFYNIGRQLNYASIIANWTTKRIQFNINDPFFFIPSTIDLFKRSDIKQMTARSIRCSSDNHPITDDTPSRMLILSFQPSFQELLSNSLSFEDILFSRDGYEELNEKKEKLNRYNQHPSKIIRRFQGRPFMSKQKRPNIFRINSGR